MRTSKAISNIAYHRPEVWKNIVDGLRKAGAIGPCLWIAHKGEKGDKPHIHFVLLSGFKTYNTDGLHGLFGIDIIGGQKASVTSIWKVTKSLNDWLLYVVHDSKYLLHKGLARECSYTWDDVQCTEGDEDALRLLLEAANEARDNLGDRTTAKLIGAAKMGHDWRWVVLQGLVPMGQFSQAMKAWEYICREYYPKPPKDESEGV